jgi:hypothetical protein
MKPNGDNLRLLYEALRTGMFQMRFNSEVKKPVENFCTKCGIAK